MGAGMTWEEFIQRNPHLPAVMEAMGITKAEYLDRLRTMIPPFSHSSSCAHSGPVVSIAEEQLLDWVVTGHLQATVSW